MRVYAYLTDDVEAQQLEAGAAVLQLSRDMLTGGERLTADELAYVARRLAECLGDALRVAASRGDRIPEP